MKGKRKGATMVAMTGTPECPYNNYIEGECFSSKEIADMANQALFVDFDVDAATPLIDPDYIQHNPGAPTGAGAIFGFVPALGASGVGLEVHRTLEMGNLVAYHSTYTNAQLFGGDTLVGFDVYRVEDGVLKEHWDNLQALVGPSPSGNTMTDGATRMKDRKKTRANKALAIAFVEMSSLLANLIKSQSSSRRRSIFNTIRRLLMV